MIDTLGCPECALDRSLCATAPVGPVLIESLPISPTAAALTANHSPPSRPGRGVDPLEDRREDLPITIGAAGRPGKGIVAFDLAADFENLRH